ncbi:hypothetical protein [Nocardia sp. NPDC051463]|uniref:hypothetical protein n=1 Tax=Nocardia sp. NPDC051463 TaxID=3154845 RepID=UPI00344C345B
MSWLEVFDESRQWTREEIREARLRPWTEDTAVLEDEALTVLPFQRVWLNDWTCGGSTP